MMTSGGSSGAASGEKSNAGAGSATGEKTGGGGPLALRYQEARAAQTQNTAKSAI